MIFIKLIWRSLIFIFWLIILFSIKISANNTIVLLYHKFGDQRTPSTNIDLNIFKEQMLYLKKHGYKVISLKQLINIIEKNKSLPSKSVVITIDDGYKSVYFNAFPILREYGYPFTVFLSTKAIEKKYPDYLSWKEIKIMKKVGADFQDHSYAHYALGIIPNHMKEDEYREWIIEDLKKSRAVFKHYLGYEPLYLAFPYGYYNKILISEALKLGYKALLTQDPGVVSEDTPLTLIPREAILGKEWSTMKHFRYILERKDLPIIEHYPEIGFLKKNPPFEIWAKIKYPKRYVKESFGIYISELGWRKAKFDENSKKVFIKSIPFLKRKINRIAITAKEKDGKEAVNFWMIILP